MVNSFDTYLTIGCMRCKYGATPKCKVLKWTNELELLREIVLECALKEEIKWNVPVYTLNGKNIITINALKESANIGFFKGALLKDDHNLLQQQGNIQLSRIIKFTSIKEIVAVYDIIKEYITEAIEIEKSGKKLEAQKTTLPIPDELNSAFEEDAEFKTAFYKLTPGRQRSYLIHFSQAKQSATRLARIQKYKELIFKGIGFNDKY
jgi:uncharacterized protein YdeI (YjbR/CyaY-like superfamily)